MFDKEQQIWDQARGCCGVAVNTLKQIVKAGKKGFIAKPSVDRVVHNKVDGEWYKRRFTIWQLCFAKLGYDLLPTTQIAKHLGRTNVSVLNDLYRLESRDMLVVRAGSTPHPKTHKPIICWTWKGVRLNANQ